MKDRLYCEICKKSCSNCTCERANGDVHAIGVTHSNMLYNSRTMLEGSRAGDNFVGCRAAQSHWGLLWRFFMYRTMLNKSPARESAAYWILLPALVSARKPSCNQGTSLSTCLTSAPTVSNLYLSWLPVSFHAQFRMLLHKVLYWLGLRYWKELVPHFHFMTHINGLGYMPGQWCLQRGPLL